MSQFIEMFKDELNHKSLCNICRPKQWPTIQTKDFTEDGYWVYGANGVIGHYSDYNHEFPTILMACRGASCGAINVSEPRSYITGNAMCLDDLSDEICFEFLVHFLSYYDYRTIITGGAQPQITFSSLQKVSVPIPSKEKQKLFVEVARQADKSGFDGFKSQFIEMFKHKKPNGKIADLVDANIKSVKKSFNKEDMIEYIDISSVNAKYRTLNEATQYIVASAPSRAQQCVQNGDILASTVRPINRNVAVVNSNLTNLVASTGFCVLRPIDGYREYLLAIVTSDKYTEKMCDIANGGLYPAVNNSDVLSYDIFIPDKDFLHRVTQIYQQADKSGFRTS